MEVLTAFIREHSREQWPPSDALPVQGGSTRPDVQAAVTVVGRRDTARDILAIDLTGAHLSGADLTGAHLGGADLGGALLTGAHLTDADLGGAILTDVRWPAGTPVPDGWKLNTDSGRLEETGTGTGPTETN